MCARVAGHAVCASVITVGKHALASPLSKDDERRVGQTSTQLSLQPSLGKGFYPTSRNRSETKN